MVIVIEKSCAFTGHRPDKLIGSEEVIREHLCEEIGKLIKLGVDTFITGMATGVDTWAAEIILLLKQDNKDLKLVCAVPFKGCEKKRTEKEQKQFHHILEKADEVEFISPNYTRWCFQERDRWMVDRASYVIAVYNGTPGGTRYTMKYAEKKGIQPIVINDASFQKCTVCGKDLTRWDLQENFSYDNIVGYGSNHYDCCHIKFRVCCRCFDKFIGWMRENAVTDPVVCTDVRSAGELTNEEAEKLKVLLSEMEPDEAEKLCHKIQRMSREEIALFFHEKCLNDEPKS